VCGIPVVKLELRWDAVRKREYYSGMKRSSAVALLLWALALPAFAQHGGGHGGFSGHSGSGPAFHSGFAASRPSAPAFAPRPAGMRPGYPNGAASGLRRTMPLRYGAQQSHYGANPKDGANGGYGVSDGRRSPYRSPYRHPDRGGIVYEYPYSGYANYGYPYGLGFYGDYSADGYDTSDSAAAQDAPYAAAQDAPYYAPDQYNGFDPQAQGQTQTWPSDQGSGPVQGIAQLNPEDPYRPYYGVPHPVARQAEEPAATLVFKDHRPNQQIRNYVINGDTLTVWDQHPHEIALDQLDIAATEKINHDAGTDLFLPGAPK